MTMNTSSADLDFAVAVIAEAGDFTLKHFRSADLQIITKADGSPVTAADEGAEQLIRQRIQENFPEDGITGEEGNDVVGTSGRRWVIDPIDGTHAFTRGVPTYTNLLYLEDSDGPSVGVINVPAMTEIVAAARGQGCTLNGVACSVNDHAVMSSAVLSCSGFDYWEEEMLQRLRASGVAMRTWGDGYGYVLVATGRIEAMFDPIINFWDIAPCQVIIPEAGGRVTTLEGHDNLELGSVLATNGVLHEPLRSMLLP